MAFIMGIPEEEASGKVKKIYESELKAKGTVSETVKIFALRPEFLESWRNINEALKSNMNERYYELATIAATSSIRCSV